ncbi:MAG: TRAP transporter permease, partial [Pseudomonadota bacterium]
PVLLFVSSTGFDGLTFAYAATSAILGVVALSASVVGYWLAPMNAIERILCAIAGLVAIAPSWQSDLVALSIAAPAILWQFAKRRSAVTVLG